MMPLPDSSLLWVDDHLVVVDKPSGLLSTEAPDRAHRSVLPRLAALLRTRGESAKLFAVHRIDEETSGTLVVARSAETRRALEATFEAHTVERIYHAIVIGAPQPSEGRLEGRLREDDDGVVRVVERGGRPARTDYSTVAVERGFAVVACRLDTGRRNQIRVQLADIGHPVAGDRKYGRRHRRFRSVPASRTMLHATAIGFTHPVTAAEISVVAPFPADFRSVLGAELSAKLSLG